MKRRGARVLALLLLCAPAARAQRPSPEPYNAVAAPLDKLSWELLTETGYVIRQDGTIWDKIADGTVRRDEMPYLLSRLAGARRLKALLELNIILNRSEGEKKLTPAEREAVRKIVRAHWPVFGVGTRRDFRSYFSVEELVALDQIPPRFDRGSALMMRDPEPVTAAASADRPAAPAARSVSERSSSAPDGPPAAEAAPAPRPERALSGAASFRPRSVLTPFLEPLSLRRPSPFAPRRAAPEPEPEPPAAAASAPPAPPASIPPAAQEVPARAAVAASPAVAAVLAAMAPAPQPGPMIFAPDAPPIPAPPPPAPPRGAPARVPISAAALAAASGPTTAPLGDSGLGLLRPWTPPPASSSAVSAASVPAAQPAAPAPAPSAASVPAAAAPPPRPADVSQSEFDAFVANGPYSREGRALLKILADKAPEFCRAILRRTVARGAPLIVLDGARTGADRRAGFAPTRPGEPLAVALSPGPLLVERKSGLFGRAFVVLPEDPRAWAELGAPMPALEAASKDAPSSARESGPWGELRVYGDKSRRGTYSSQQQAGELLERLLLLGLEREGFGSSVYAARAWARAARLLLWARLAEEGGQDAFLDPDRRLELREWIERGDEADDLAVGAWSSSRGNVLDPRRGGPDSQARYERAARPACARALLADHLAEAARVLAARVRTLEALQEADLISADAARKAAAKASDEEAAARASLLAAPPPCDGRFGADEAGLRRSTALLAEASRAERAFRERRSKELEHASKD